MSNSKFDTSVSSTSDSKFDTSVSSMSDTFSFMILPSELYFCHIVQYLDVADIFNLLCTEQVLLMFDTKEKWLNMLATKYPKYHKILIGQKNINKFIIKEMLYILNIINEDQEKERIYIEKRKKEETEHLRIVRKDNEKYKYVIFYSFYQLIKTVKFLHFPNERDNHDS